MDETLASAGFRLRRLTHLDVRSVSLAAGSCAETSLAGVKALLVRPVGPPAEMQVYVAWDVAEYVWERIWEAGQEWRIRPLGADDLPLMSRSAHAPPPGSGGPRRRRARGV